mmetsp:Transcript_42710/g.117903  ORF Transcript_42710/g.117903 Transcript_42710/m.117903 type:complete len:248 (-) Transcript_42710:42-785(-)
MPKCHAAREALRACGDRDELAHAIWVFACGANALHASQGRPNASMDGADAQVVKELELRVDLVEDSEPWEAAPISFPVQVEGRRSSGSIAPAEVVRANDVKQIRVQRFAGADEVLPPAGRGVLWGRARVRGRRHAALEQDHVRPPGVQIAPRFVSDLELGQHLAISQGEGLFQVKGLVACEIAGHVLRLLLNWCCSSPQIAGGHDCSAPLWANRTERDACMAAELRAGRNECTRTRKHSVRTGGVRL